MEPSMKIRRSSAKDKWIQARSQDRNWSGTLIPFRQEKRKSQDRVSKALAISTLMM
ncbi:hypothetical protein YC2023_048135 [Brassica napus]